MNFTIILMLSLFSLTGCVQESTTKKTSSTSTSTNNLSFCDQNPMAFGCPQFCAANPGMCSSGGTSGGTTGTTTGGTTTGTTTGGSGTQPYTGIPSDNNWQSLYQDGAPTGNCSTPTGTGLDLRTGTITLAGDNTYYMPGGDTSYLGRTGKALTSPTDMAAFTTNISSFLTIPSQAKSFYESDGRLKVRFKPRPQPLPPVGQTWCYNRLTGRTSDNWGYRILKFAVSAVGVNANGTLQNSNGFPIVTNTKYVEVGVNSCSAAIDFSGVAQQPAMANGMVLVIHDLQSDQSCWYNNTCTGYKTMRRASCWQMDIEVSVDDTKDIN